MVVNNNKWLKYYLHDNIYNMLNYIYYLFGAGLFGSVGFVIYYIIDPDNAGEIAQKITWNGVKCYHKTKNEIKKINNHFNNLQKKSKKKKKGLSKYNIKLKKTDCKYYENEDDYDDNNIEFIGYKIKDDTTFTTYDLQDDYIYDNTFDVIFLKKEENNKNIYKRLLDKNNIDEEKENFSLVQKPFVQVELVQNNEKISIHKKLENFYVKNNVILDRKFLVWFIKYKYFVTLNEDYKVNIIDSNINMFNIKKNEKIRILEDNKGENDTYLVEE